MYRVEALRPKPIGDRRRQVHVDEKTHRWSPDDDDAVVGQPSRVVERLADVRGFQVGILGQQLLRRRPFRHARTQVGHAAPEASNAGPSAHLPGLEGDPVQPSRLHRVLPSPQHRIIGD